VYPGNFIFCFLKKGTFIAHSVTKRIIFKHQTYFKAFPQRIIDSQIGITPLVSSGTTRMAELTAQRAGGTSPSSKSLNKENHEIKTSPNSTIHTLKTEKSNSRLN
jgi:hypothetical protein